jgi:hypothetical protein
MAGLAMSGGFWRCGVVWSRCEPLEDAGGGGTVIIQAGLDGNELE